MNFKELWQQAVTLFKSMSRVRQVGVVVAILAVLGAGAFFALYEPPVEYRTVFAELSESEAAAIVEQLEADKITHELVSEMGRVSIKVPTALAEKVRLSIASKGLAAGRFGFTDYIAAPYTVSAKRERKLHTIALAGELGRIIGDIDGVQNAEVTLTIPEKSVFREAAEAPRASVMVRLRPGRRLGQAEVRGIVNLVAGSVQGLEPREVTLVDGAARQLWHGEDETWFTDLQEKKERDVRRKIEMLLDKAVGPGEYHVTVSAAFERSLRTEESETFETTESSIVSKQFSEEIRNPRVVRAGLAGARGNQALVAPGLVTTPTTVQGPVRRSETINNAPNRTLTRVEQKRPRLLGVAVSVLINTRPEPVPVPTSSVATASTGLHLARSEVQLGPARHKPDIAALSELIRVAAGLDLAGTKDQLFVTTSPIWKPAPPPIIAPEPVLPPWYAGLPPYAYAGAAGGVFLILVAIALLVRRRNRARAEEEAELLAAPTRADELEAALDGAEYEPEPTLAELRDKVHERVDGDADLAAEILSAWINEGRDDGDDDDDLEEAA